MNAAPRHGAPGAPRPNPLQRLWLREIGIDKTWLPQDEPAPQGAAQAAAAAASAPERVSAAQQMSETPRSVPAAKSASEDAPAAKHPPVVAPSPAPRARAPEPVEADAPQPEPVSQAQRLAAIAQADIDELRGMVQGCTACGLCQGRRNAVFGMGPPLSSVRWMVVGEAPGAEEDRQGLPFVGRSGQLLDTMLAAVGMSRERDVFIGNVIKCRPPGNRNPAPEEVAACSPYLLRQIALVKPERILILGRFAAQTLLGTDATIGSLRGRVHEVEVEGRRIPAVVSYHPAYLLRSPAEKARSWQDLRLAARSV